MDDFPREVPTIAARLLEARHAAKLTTRKVAEALDAAGCRVSHATIGNYERGASVPDVRVLTHLATLYSRDVDWFLRPVRPLVGVRFRQASSLVRVADEKQYLATATHWLEAYWRLEQAVRKPLCGKHAGFSASPETTGQQLAEKVRRDHLGLTDDTAPVASVIEVMEDFYGIRVIELATEYRIDGLAARFGDEHAVVLNPCVPNDRNRWNAGHELGHVLLADCEERSLLTHNDVEGRSFEFGFHLLMSEAILREAFQGKSMVKLVAFKERYGVSLAAMIYRAEKKGIISEKETEWLWRQFAIRGWRKKEPGEVRPDRATRFERLYEEAVGRNRLGRQAVLRAMGVRKDEMTDRLRSAAGMVRNPEPANEDNEKGGEGSPDVLRFPQ